MNERNARIALAAIFFLYVLMIRTYDVATTFLMLGEQTRDWVVALGGISNLPLTGAPSTAGGRGLGPLLLAAVDRTCDDRPVHGQPAARRRCIVALLQSIADVWLFIALSRRVHWAFALAMCLLIASAPFDIAMSSVIWNPPVSAALIKTATAMAMSLTGPRPCGRLPSPRLSRGWRFKGISRRRLSACHYWRRWLSVRSSIVRHHRRMRFSNGHNRCS